MKKNYTSAEVCTLDNFDNPFGDNHQSPSYNLSEHFSSIFSQHGEDGLIQYLYSIIDPKKKYYVEFGASNGNSIENTRSLRVNHGWSGLLMLPITDGSLLSPFRSSNAFCSALCVKPIGGSLAIENIRSYRCPREPASPPKLSGSFSIN